MDCPECGKELHEYARSCSCGWKDGTRITYPSDLTKPFVWGPIDPAVLAKIHETMERMKKPHDPKAWARRILERHAAGTYTFAYGIESARKALGLGPDREPGEEG